MLLGKSVLLITCLMDNSSIWRGGITIQKNSNTNHIFFFGLVKMALGLVHASLATVCPIDQLQK